MNTPTFLKFNVSVSTVASLLCGCASVGHDFKYQNAGSLELGQVRSSEYQAMFGKPSSVEVKDTPEDKFELVTYQYAAAGVGYSPRSRLLELEFRNGALNSYCYLNNFDTDKLSVSTDRLSEIKSGASKKDDVLRILGKPEGKALCPTYSTFKGDCGKGHEIWLWMVVGRGGNAKAQGMMVSFDKDGVVTAIEATTK